MTEQNHRYQVTVEICGICNARCPWCITGRGGHPAGSLMPLESFQRCIARLVDLALLSPGDLVYLYNWGEPTLNKDLDGMLSYLGQRGLKGFISTNGIKRYLPGAEALKGLGGIKFSVSGMTDASEMRIHGASAQAVLGNIDALAEHLKQAGWRGNLNMDFHLYQHNMEEYAAAHDFCRQRGLLFNPYYAYFNDYILATGYLKHTLEYGVLERASKELVLYYVDGLISRKPEGWRCMLNTQQIVIDEQCNVLTCCGLPRDHEEYAIGSVFELTAYDMQSRKARVKICAECESSGMAWWGTHPQSPEALEGLMRDRPAATTPPGGAPRTARSILRPFFARILKKT